MKLSTLIDAFQPAEGSPPNTLLAFLTWNLHGSFPVLWLAAAVAMIAGMMEALTALMLGWIVDATIDVGPSGYFNENILMLAGIVVFLMLLRPLAFAANAASTSIIVGPNVSQLVLSRLHRHTIGQAVSFFDDDFAGRIAQKQMQASRAITEVTVECINVVAFALASLVGSAALLITIDTRVAWILAIWLVAYLGLIRLFLPQIRKRAAARAGTRANVTGQIVDTVTNIKTVHLFAHGEHEDQAALGAMRTFRTASLEFGYLSTWFRFSLMTLAGLLPILLVGATLYLWSNGSASPGNIVAAGAIAIRIAQMTGWVSFALLGIYANIGEAEDAMRTLAHAHKLTDRTGATDLQNAEGEIEINDLQFMYGRKTGGVDGVTITMKPGEKLGLVGSSGAGKSTLVALLMRLYDPEKGEIRLDGHDLRDLTMLSLRRQISMVTQETAMFNRSALDNIAYGRPDATKAEIIAAAKQAEAHEFIETLQDHAGRVGYAANLGERGVKLSGGQRQRIALARAILKDAPVLILDEATSALDSEIEASIQAALTTVMKGKTVIAIAHRLSTIAQMDRIVVLEAGQIAEEGSHTELLAKGGLYARFWDRQSGGFIDVKAAQ
ncbi:MAG: ATP-binding cassette subfamily B protein [Paracoccaceae bacterium]|jgi:ATP-binding cassette subfamily B protein